MGQVIEVEFVKKEEVEMRHRWTGDAFHLSNRSYYDRAISPPFPVHNDIRLIRGDILARFPKVVTGDTFNPIPTKLVMPMCLDAEPLWTMGIEEGLINNPYEPYTVLMYVIREHCVALYEMTDGAMVYNNADYEQLKDDFNNLWRKFKTLRACGSSGNVSEDSMIRLGAMFYLLLHTCSNIEGLLLDSDGRFENSWCGEKVIIDSTVRTLQAYSAKLKGMAVSGLPWRHFAFRNLQDSDSETFWYFSIPKVEASNRFPNDFDVEDLYDLLGDIIPMLSSRRSRVMIVLPMTESRLKRVIDHFGFSLTGEDLYVSSHMKLQTNVVSRGGIPYCIMTNYDSDKDTYEVY